MVTYNKFAYFMLYIYIDNNVILVIYEQYNMSHIIQLIHTNKIYITILCKYQYYRSVLNNYQCQFFIHQDQFSIFLHILLPKRFGDTYIYVGGAFLGPAYCRPSLTEAVTSQAGHILLAYQPIFLEKIIIKDERIKYVYHISSLLT